jgi:hypothetical protein
MIGLHSALFVILATFLGCSSAIFTKELLQPPKDLEDMTVVETVANEEEARVPEAKQSGMSLDVPKKKKPEKKRKKRKKEKKPVKRSTLKPVITAAPQKQPKPVKKYVQVVHPDNPEELPSMPFAVGEEVILSLQYMGIEAGEASLKVQKLVRINDRFAYHFRASAKSSPLFALFYELDDYIDCYVDAITLRPIKTRMHIDESKQRKDQLIFFDNKNKVARFWMHHIKLEKNEEKEERRNDPYPVPALEGVSAIYYARTLKLEVGTSEFFEFYDDKKIFSIEIQILRKEKLKTRFGEYNTIVVRPLTRYKGILKRTGDILVWITDDKYRRIIRLKSQLKIGALNGYLKKIKD